MAVCWAIACVPFLRMPASPPGVGDPGSITARQQIYVATLAFSLVASAAALQLGRAVSHAKRSSVWGWLTAVAIAGLTAVVVLAVVPPNPDLVSVPLDLLTQFRVKSALGPISFWAAFAALFAVFVARGQRDGLPRGGGV